LGLPGQFAKRVVGRKAARNSWKEVGFMFKSQSKADNTIHNVASSNSSASYQWGVSSAAYTLALNRKNIKRGKWVPAVREALFSAGVGSFLGKLTGNGVPYLGMLFPLTRSAQDAIFHPKRSRVTMVTESVPAAVLGFVSRKDSIIKGCEHDPGRQNVPL